jgi:hypothetical protein
MAPPTQPRPKTMGERRSGYGSRPPMDGQSMAPSTYRDGIKRTYRRAPFKLVPTRASGATRYNKPSLTGPSLYSEFPPGMALLKTRSYRCYVRTFYGTTPRAKNPKPTIRKTNKTQVLGTHHSQHQPVDRDDETVHDQDLGSHILGAKTLALLSPAWAPNTASTYGSTIRRYFDFCEEERLAPPAATPAHMARYVAWLGQLGTIKASSMYSSLQP